ncbi:MAG: hypothetical protein Q9M92_07365 [Enterobacterales bacterium]|nr:hypothetical protein [Enterobacterales bacterium]
MKFQNLNSFTICLILYALSNNLISDVLGDKKSSFEEDEIRECENQKKIIALLKNTVSQKERQLALRFRTQKKLVGSSIDDLKKSNGNIKKSKNNIAYLEKKYEALKSEIDSTYLNRYDQKEVDKYNEKIVELNNIAKDLSAKKNRLSIEIKYHNNVLVKKANEANLIVIRYKQGNQLLRKAINNELEVASDTAIPYQNNCEQAFLE